MAVGPGEAERADEPGRPVRGVTGFAMDPLHGGGEVLRGRRPSGRVDAGRAAQCRDAEAGIVGQRRQAGRGGRRQRLEPRVADEIVRGLLRLRQAKRAGGHARDAVRRAQVGDLAQLAGIVGGDHRRSPRGERRAIRPLQRRRCKFVQSRRCRPAPAPSARRNAASENGDFSAVPWISTMPPPSVSTKLASASAG